MNAPLRIAVLGSTGSIGLNTLDVLERHRDRYQVFALAARNNVARLREQCLQHRPRFAVVVDNSAAALLTSQLRSAGSPTEVLTGEQALSDVAAHSEVDAIMAAIVGAAGLASSLAAARAGKRILLANKEALVMAAAAPAACAACCSRPRAVRSCAPPPRIYVLSLPTRRARIRAGSWDARSPWTRRRS